MLPSVSSERVYRNGPGLRHVHIRALTHPRGARARPLHGQQSSSGCNPGTKFGYCFDAGYLVTPVIWLNPKNPTVFQVFGPKPSSVPMAVFYRIRSLRARPPDLSEKSVF